MENGEIPMKEQVISKVRQIHKDEKFRLDAYFFCGYPAGAPNEKLVKACGNYLEAIDAEKADEDATANLIAVLEETVSAESKIADVDNLLNNTADLQHVLANREYL